MTTAFIDGIVLVGTDGHVRNVQCIQYLAKSLDVPFLLCTSPDAIDKVKSLPGKHLILSLTNMIPNDLGPDKHVVSGPNFCVHQLAEYDQSKHGTLIINSLCDWVMNVYNFAKPGYNCIKAPFPLDPAQFLNPEPRSERTSIILYFKNQNPVLFQLVQSVLTDFCATSGMSLQIFVYGQYNGLEYLKALARAKFAVFLVGSESQGFAIQECMVNDVPMIVWETKFWNDNIPIDSCLALPEYKGQRFPSTAVNLWNSTCGIKVDSCPELMSAMKEVVNNGDQFHPAKLYFREMNPHKCLVRLWPEMACQVTCLLQGGLGNQFFQVATTLATAWKQGLIPVFERAYPDSNHVPENTKRPSYWGTVFHKCKTIESQDWRKISWKMFEEPGNGALVRIPIVNRNSLVKGYFQSSHYFDEYFHELEKFIQLPPNDQLIVDKVLHRLPQPGTGLKIGIHVRRGDYLWLGHTHPVLDVDYYIRAKKQILDLVSPQQNIKWILFSEDPAWCFENLVGDGKVFPSVHHVITPEDYHQVFVMKELDGWILANSSFSWMGAYLGDPLKSKPVVAPRGWFSPGSGIQWDKIYLDHWKMI